MRVVIVYCTREFCNLLRWNYDREVTTFSVETLISANHCCEIAISHVIPDEQPVRFRSQVGVLTTAYRRGPEVRFGEVTWTCSRHLGDVLRTGLILDNRQLATD